MGMTNQIDALSVAQLWITVGQWRLYPEFHVLVERPWATGDSAESCRWITKPAYLSPYSHQLEWS